MNTFQVMSPDGLPITETLYPTLAAAKLALSGWCQRFVRQGYYSAADGRRIALADLPAACSVTEVTKAAIHKSLTIIRVSTALENDFDNPGFCTFCGQECIGVEPDARNYMCEECNEPAVFGAEELLTMLAENFVSK